MTPATTKACKLCARQIPFEAKKCNDCGEFQSVFTRVVRGIDLKALLALLPLLTLIYAFLADRLEVARSDLQVAAVACEAESVTLFASNAGTRTALLQHVGFAATGDEESVFELPTDLPQRVFAAGEARLIEVHVDAGRNPAGLASFQSRQRPDCAVALRFEILNHDHTVTEEDQTCACPLS
ncbi:MAG: hypothetical protein AAFX81_10800 [Pseudomonadota bacterium]